MPNQLSGFSPWDLTRWSLPGMAWTGVESLIPNVSYTDPTTGTTVEAAQGRGGEIRNWLSGNKKALSSRFAPQVEATAVDQVLNPQLTEKQKFAQTAEQIKQLMEIQKASMADYTMTKQEQMDFVNMQDEQKRKHAIDLINRQQGFNKENLGLQFGYNTQLADQAFGHNMQLGQMQGDYNLVQQNMRNLTDQSLAQVKTFGDSWNNWQQSIYGMANATSPARALLAASRHM